MKTIPVSDFQAAVVLSALGFKLIDIDKSNPRFTFLFENNPELEKFLERFYRSELSLDPKLVLLHQKLIKDRMYQST